MSGRLHGIPQTSYQTVSKRSNLCVHTANGNIGGGRGGGVVWGVGEGMRAQN